MSVRIPSDITQMLASWSNGDPAALPQLAEALYQDLRRIAISILRRESPNITLQATSLVHELYVKLNTQDRAHFESRGHFFAIAARLMRHIIVDHARHRNAAKRGGGQLPNELADNLATPEMSLDYLALDKALHELQAIDARKGQVVELKFFLGLSIPEIAAFLNISDSTVEREWALSRAWLRKTMRGL
ncbi:sigma-70 family RNA polymerase sigma factor [Bryobacter aggregatus]|uniref:sigma-70 family RNA polymerase sigma factor n=1 Tax=Bryobacter aggregatus TaxID=360054 RepID=UPI00138E20F7|nr:sigma-70 family RNA polymerase sigma factor [Bryobacter aggregatus]